MRKNIFKNGLFVSLFALMVAIPDSVRAESAGIKITNWWGDGTTPAINNAAIITAPTSKAYMGIYTQLYGTEVIPVEPNNANDSPEELEYGRFSLYNHGGSGQNSELSIFNAGRIARARLDQTTGTTLFNFSNANAQTTPFDPFAYPDENHIPAGGITTKDSATADTKMFDAIGREVSSYNFSPVGEIYGTVMLGKNARLYNMGKIARIDGNPDIAENVQSRYLINDPEIDDVLSLGSGSEVYNGWIPQQVKVDFTNSYPYWDNYDSVIPTASITEKEIRFTGSTGTLYNAGEIGSDQGDVRIAFEGQGRIENKTTPYSEAATTTHGGTVPFIAATQITMGDNSTIANDFGGEIYVSGVAAAQGGRKGIVMGDGSTIINGQTPTITNVPSTDIDEYDEEYELPVTVNPSYMIVKGNIEMGDGATIYNTTDPAGTSKPTLLAIGTSTSTADPAESRIVVGASSKVINTGAEITSRALKEEKGRVVDGQVQTYHTYLGVGNGSTVDNNTFYYSDAGETKAKLATIQLEGLIGRAKNISGYDPTDYAEGVTVNNTGYVKLELLKLGHGAIINNNVLKEDNLTTDGRIRSDKAIMLGDMSVFNNAGRVVTEKLQMGNFSTLKIDSEAPVALVAPKAIQPDEQNNNDTSSYKQQAVLKENIDSSFFTDLTMGEASSLTTNTSVYAKTKLGEGSAVVLTAAKVGDKAITRTDHLFADANWGVDQGGSIIGSLTQTEDDSNTILVTSNSAQTSYTKLEGWADENGASDVAFGLADVQTGTLEMSGHISGKTKLASNTVLRLTGEQTDYQGSIVKGENAQNTTLYVQTPLFETTGALNVDTVYLAGGAMTLNSNTNVNVGEYLLGNNSTLKFKVQPEYTGSIERFEGAYNTNLHIEMAEPSVVFVAPGKIDVDKLTVAQGIFSVSVGKEDITSTGGIDLSSNATLEVKKDADWRVTSINGYNSTYGKVIVDNSKLTVRKPSSFDSLVLNKGHFVYNGETTDLGVLNIFKDVIVGEDSSFTTKGTVQVRQDEQNVRSLTVQKGGKFQVKDTENGHVKMVANLNLQAGSQTIIDADNYLYMPKGTFTPGTIFIENNARLFVNNPTAGMEYKVASTDTAEQWLNTEAEVESYLKSSILYIDPTFDLRFEDGKGNLYFRMNGTTDLYNALWPELSDANDRAMLGAMDKIHKSGGKVPSWLQDILDAPTKQQAASYIIEQNPDVHTNLVKSALQVNRSMTRQLSSVLHDIHTVKARTPAQGYYKDQSRYYNYGRSGGDTYYRYRGRYYPYIPYTNSSANTTTTQAQTYNVGENTSARSDDGALWVKPFTNKYDQDTIGGISGYSLKNYGIMAGADIDFNELTLGIMGMYNDGDYKGKDKLFNADITSYALGLYGSYQPDESSYFVDFYATWMNSKQETTQKLSTGNVTADYDTQTLSGGMAVGYPITFADHFAFVPSVGVDYARITPDDFTEKSTEADIGTKKVKNKKFQSLQSALTARLLANFNVGSARITPEVFGKWAHEFKDRAASATIAFTDYPTYTFDVKGKDADKELYTLGGTLSVTADETDRLFFTYAYDFNDTVTGHTFELGYLHSF